MIARYEHPGANETDMVATWTRCADRVRSHARHSAVRRATPSCGPTRAGCETPTASIFPSAFRPVCTPTRNEQKYSMYSMYDRIELYATVESGNGGMLRLSVTDVRVRGRVVRRFGCLFSVVVRWVPRATKTRRSRNSYLFCQYSGTEQNIQCRVPPYHCPLRLTINRGTPLCNGWALYMHA